MPKAATRSASLALLLALAACADQKPPPPKAVPVAPPVGQVCADFSFPIYFETASDRLTVQARQALTEATSRVRGCSFGRIDVLGLADADGTARANLALSRRRAATVAQALAAGGLPRPEFDIDGAGQAGAVTAAGQPEPLRRRAEVVIRASTPPPAPPRP